MDFVFLSVNIFICDPILILITPRIKKKNPSSKVQIARKETTSIFRHIEH